MSTLEPGTREERPLRMILQIARKEPIPTGWVTVKQAARMNRKLPDILCCLIDAGWLDYVSDGQNRYVDPDAVRSAWRARNAHNEQRKRIRFSGAECDEDGLTAADHNVFDERIRRDRADIARIKAQTEMPIITTPSRPPIERIKREWKQIMRRTVQA